MTVFPTAFMGPLAKVAFATHLPRAQVPGEITEKMSFKSFFSKLSVCSVANCSLMQVVYGITNRKMGRVGEFRATSWNPAFTNADAVPVWTNGAGRFFCASIG